MPTRFGHDVVGQVIGLSYQGLGAKAIANRLRDRGVAISASTVWRILQRGRATIPTRKDRGEQTTKGIH